MPEQDWIRLQAIDLARTSDKTLSSREDRIYDAAIAVARRRGAWTDLSRSIDALCREGVEVAGAMAGPEAAAAFARFEEVINGRRLLADAADEPAVSRYLGFRGAAVNTIRAAAFRPFVSAADHAFLWTGYATVLDFSRRTKASDEN
jgi:hypothetical protein